MKKRVLQGLGMALLLASPIWLTFSKPPNYFNFGVSSVLGVVLLVLALSVPPRNPGR